jgi:hypothetical protein
MYMKLCKRAIIPVLNLARIPNVLDSFERAVVSYRNTKE